jgi:hypothetical protein
MQDGYIPIKGSRKLLRQIAERIGNTLTGPKSGDDNKTADTFLVER